MPCVVLSATETGIQKQNICIHTSLSLGGLISARLLLATVDAAGAQSGRRASSKKVTVPGPRAPTGTVTSSHQQMTSVTDEIYECELSANTSLNDVSLDCKEPTYKVIVRLSNTSAEGHQAFKCKTNAPRRWSVKPNGGILNPGQSIDVYFKLASQSEAAAAAAFENSDRHMIVSAAVSAEEAARLQQQRKDHPRSSLAAPDLGMPGVSQIRVTPVFQLDAAHAAAAAPANAVQTAADAAPAIAAPSAVSLTSPHMKGHAPPTVASIGTIETMHSPLISPAPSVSASPLLPASDGAAPDAAPSPPSPTPKSAPRFNGASAATPFAKQESVAARIAELNRWNASQIQGLLAQGNGFSTAAGGAGGQQLSNGADDGASVAGSEDGGRRTHGRRGLAGYLLSLLNRGSEEFVPWLSWKVRCAVDLARHHTLSASHSRLRSLETASSLQMVAAQQQTCGDSLHTHYSL